MKKTLGLCLTLLATGCAIGPDYKQPLISTPDAFRGLPANAQSAALDAPWWRQFGDPVLDRYVDEALVHNRDLAIALANIEAAAGQLTTAGAALYPTLGYQLNGQRGRSAQERLAGQRGDINTYQFLGNASWEIDLWGSLRRQKEAAAATLAANEQARRGALMSVTGAVVQGYLQLRGLDRQLEITRRSAQSYEETVKLFELQYQYGAVARINVEQVKSQYQQALTAIPPLEASITQSENALSLLLGRNPGPIARGKNIDELTLPQVPAALPSALLNQRPDILEAERQLVAANAQIGVARAQFFPTISLTGAAGSVSPQLYNLFNGGTSIWSVAAAVAGTVFSGGSTVGLVRTAEARTRVAEETYKKTVQQAFADIENALSLYAADGRKLLASQALSRSSKEYADLAWLQYDGGLAPYLTVLDARRQLYSAEIDTVQARTSQLNEAVALYLAFGGGWINSADRLNMQAKAN